MAGRLNYEKGRDYGWIITGTLLMALSANLCFTPAKIVPGGFTGLAIIIKYCTGAFVKNGIPTWLSNILLNIPLILAAVRIRGWSFMRRTFAASAIFSVWLFLIPEYPLFGEDLFLVTLGGGVLMGVGLGFVFLGKATTGGTDTLGALLLRAYPHMSTAKLMQIIDAAVVLLAIGIFGIHISMYAIIAVTLSSYVADRITSGFRNAYFAHIISERYQEIAEEIMKELDRGVTLLSGKGMYTGSDRPVLLCAVKKRQTMELRDIVYSIDPGAFMIISDAKDVRGEGFMPPMEETL